MKMSASRDPVSNGSVSSVVAHADSRAHAAAGDASERNRSATSDRVHASAEPVDVGEELEEELEWEDWNGRGSFGHHMIAGSAAGVVEHLAMFPVDTYKTHQQTYAAKLSASLAAGRAPPEPPPTLTQMIRRDGMLRLWRGAPAVLLGCIPSHAAYFTAYELGRDVFGLNREDAGHQPVAAASTGALATILHDGIMTPMDVVKQRLQLGYYSGVMQCLRSVIREEGAYSLWRSYPTTLLMNVPYAAAVVAANESFKQLWVPITGKESMLTYILSGAGAGAIAAAATCPLDVVKTRLQTAAVLARDSMPPGGGGSGSSATAGKGASVGARAARTTGTAAALPGGLQAQVAMLSTAAGGSATGAAGPAAPQGRLQLPGALDVAKVIWREEGAAGFMRGVKARMAVHTPSQAISWATYEGIRGLLIKFTAAPGAGAGPGQDWGRK